MFVTEHFLDFAGFRAIRAREGGEQQDVIGFAAPAGHGGTIELVRPRILRLVREPAVVSSNESLERAGRGDREAFEAVYNEFGSRVYGIVLRVLLDDAMAEEVTQDVFVQIWRQAERFDPEQGNARSWILTIAHRRAVDRVRKEESRRRREKADHEATPVVLVDDVAEAVAGRSERDRVHAALETIPSAQREAVALAYFEGNTYREVAEILEIPEGTAKSRIRDGLRRLRDTLGAPS